MNPEIQRFLAEQLESLRTVRREHPDADLRTNEASLSGALEALSLFGSITSSEFSDWVARADAAAGRRPMHPADSSAMRLFPTVRAAPDAERTQKGSDAPSRFSGLLLGPDEERELFGGRLRLLAVEMYDDYMAVQWRMAPLHDPSAVFPEDFEQAQRDIEGLPSHDDQRSSLEVRYRGAFWRSFDIGDDCHTAYQVVGALTRNGPKGNDMYGRLTVLPAPPSVATILTIGVPGIRWSLPLPRHSE